MIQSIFSRIRSLIVTCLYVFSVDWFTKTKMADFQSQGKIFWISLIVYLLAIPIAIIYAFLADNYLKALFFIIYVTAVLFVLFVPNWPWLNKNKPQWRKDSEFFDEVNKAKKQENAQNKKRKTH